MSKYTITLTKSEIEAAILDYIDREVTISGRKKLQDPKLAFRDKDGGIGYLEVDIHVDEGSTNNSLEEK